MNIYSEKKFLEKKFCFNQYYPLLQNFLAKEVKLGSEFISPYRFAAHYGMSIRDVINFFIALSGDIGVFERYYKVECECGEYAIFNETDISFTCPYCYEEDISINSSLSNVDLLFKIKETTLNELRDELKKVQSSSNSTPTQSITLEEGNQSIPRLSLGEVIADQEITEENPEASAMKQYATNLLRNSIGAT